MPDDYSGHVGLGMTRDDVIRMAREAGCIKEDWLEANTRFLGRFAALVAAAEREACAKVCEKQITGYHFLATHGHFDHMDQAATLS